MNENDAKAHPWPPKGDWVEWRWREAVWMPTRPWYGFDNKPFKPEDVWFMAVFKSWFPFLTWRVEWILFGRKMGFHGYIGGKPIPVATDPAFHWSTVPTAQKFIREGRLFVQMSCRPFGVGAIS